MGSANDYSFSPNENEIAFTMNESNFLATSTNNDIFILNVNDIKDGEQTPYKKFLQVKEMIISQFIHPMENILRTVQWKELV